MENKFDIFISYRRVDSDGRTSGRDIARTIKLELEKRGYSVFFDYSEIKDNEFENVILPAIQNSIVFIVVLSKDALKRCSNDNDWVRNEIETAIKCGCKIIPVNPDGAFDGWPRDIPDSIYPLTKQQISDISMGSLFEKSIDKLEEERICSFIKKITQKQEEISLQNIRDSIKPFISWLKESYNTIVNTWGSRSIITNIIFCLYILPTILLTFFLVDFEHRNINFIEVSIGFYAISLLYCVFQYFMNRRDGIYIIILSIIITIITGAACLGTRNDHYIDSTMLLLLYSILLFCSLAIRKNGKSTWQHLNGGLYGLFKWKRHFIFYLWCITWICLVIFKKHNEW